MGRYSAIPLLVALSLFVALTAVSFQCRAAVDRKVLAELEQDQAGSSDDPAAGRYAGAHLLAQTVKEFDELTLPAGPAVGHSYESTSHFQNATTARGRVIRSLYVGPAGRSTLEILSNHEDALKSHGYALVYECNATDCGENFARLKYGDAKKETYVMPDKVATVRRYLIEASLDYVQDVRYALFKKSTGASDAYVGIYVATVTGGSHGDSSDALTGRPEVLIEAVEPKAMESNIVTVKADDIGAKVASEGRAVFYGLYFVFNSATIKPESEQQMAELAKYLSAQPSTRVYIVGHTDNQGGLDYNLGLSAKRASAVVDALATKYHIDRKRMVAQGVGPLAPVASNRDESGRSKNRRVEMVEQVGP